MCGIAGYLGRTIPGLLPRMMNGIRHRGPDGEREFVAPPLHLGHAPLAIIDLETGAHPMHPAGERSLNPGAIRDYLQFRYVPSGRHFFEGVATLPPATILECGFDGGVTTTAFWAPRRRTPEEPADVESWVEGTRTLLDDA